MEICIFEKQMDRLTISDQTGITEVFNYLPGNYLILFPDAPRFTIAAVTNAYNKVTMTDRKQIIGKGLFEAFPDNPDDPDANGVANLSASLMEAIRTRKPHKMAVQKYDIQNPEGPGFYARYWSPINTPVMNDAGEVIYLIHYVEDVSEEFRTAKALENKTMVLERTNEELEQFVRISSHDLQEPLRKIRTFIGMLKSLNQHKMDEKSLVLMGRIEDAAERMSNRMRDLLKYAFLQQNISKSEVDLNEVIADVLDDLTVIIEEKNAVIEIEHLPVIPGIRHQLHQLFYNLLINAMQFSHNDKPPKVKISVRTFSENETGNEFVEIVIADNGIGFDQQHAEKIFTVFERLEKDNYNSGTGIGLSICKKVVNNHGGSIHAIGELTQGANFHILLPAR